MYSNKAAIEMFNKMIGLGQYYSSGRPVKIDPSIIVQDILSKLPLSAADVILDVGCGTGVVTFPLAAHCKLIHAIDAGENVIREAQQYCAAAGISSIIYETADALDLPFPDACFDHVLAYAVVHYFEGADQILRLISELARVCKKGGRILVGEVPDFEICESFEKRNKTPEEAAILESFKRDRVDYDRLFAQVFQMNVSVLNTPLVSCKMIVDAAEANGCDTEIFYQDRRQPFSLTRRDVLLIKR